MWFHTAMISVLCHTGLIQLYKLYKIIDPAA